MYWIEWPGFRETRVLTTGWSWRCRPTPGRLWIRGIPCLSNSSLGPTPESRRIWGEWTAPALNTILSIMTLRKNKKKPYAKTTSFFTRTQYFGPSRLRANSTPTAFFTSLVVSKRTLVTVEKMATFRLGRLRTSGVIYADSVVTRRPFLSIYVTKISVWIIIEREQGYP